ncbi:hypothetical protein ES705_34215 [subsurface metagenome]|jgi:hypothetical protein
MTTVKLEKSEVEELINYKLRNLHKEIQNILDRWNETSIDKFVEKARNGTYGEAENDAIDIRQLVLEQKKLQELQEKL